jgi:hypothetical protein
MLLRKLVQVTLTPGDGHWVFVENSPNGEICDLCGQRVHKVWLWYATATKCRTRYCVPCVAGLINDPSVIEAFA